MKFDPLFMPARLQDPSQHRIRRTFDLFNAFMPTAVVCGKVAALERMISRYVRLEEKDGDLDTGWPYSPIDGSDVLCFEVLEHVANPLFLLENIRRHLAATGGKLHLTTPLVSGWIRPRGFVDPAHFNEFDRDRLEWLFRKARLQVETHRTFLTRRWWTYLTPRGIVRLFTDRTILIVARPIP